MVYTYQKNNCYFGQLASGMETCGAAELEELGATNIRSGYRGIYFCADPESLYRICYCSRIFIRFLAPLITFDCHSAKYLLRTATSIDWPSIFSLDQTFAIVSNATHSPAFRNSQYAAQVVKDAICDRFRNDTGQRPSVDTRNPDLWINLHIHENKARVSIDVSGGSLHKRGYRKESVKAPMQETLAAAIIRLSGWDGERPLYDPFCGSGTLLSEALMRHCRIPASYLRTKFGFFRLPDFDTGLWSKVKTEADAKIRELPADLLQGSDIDPEALKAVRANRAALPGGENIRVRRSDFHALEGFSDTTIVTNPPYGIRLGDAETTAQLLKEFGDFLKQKCTGSTAYVYYGEKTMVKKLGLKPEWKNPLRNGQLDGMLCKYELY